ncbi:protein JINGUBANG [Sesamum angolense]|uniref:Protein JINGUBANG n=1 Tax=Sesamum angolense TaxID=2727404 RepID=A0AAE2BYX8_9LAMI|nr:protein JINGUBANG [Sesamum angolense]
MRHPTTSLPLSLSRMVVFIISHLLSLPPRTPNRQKQRLRYHTAWPPLKATRPPYSPLPPGKHLYSGASDGEIRVWDRNPSSSHGYTVAEGCSSVKSIVVSGDKLFTAHHDHKIRVWKIENSADYQKYKLVTVLPTLSDRCMRLLSAKNYVKVRRHKKCTWVHHVDAVSALALTRDGSLLYSVSWDRTLKVWRTSDFKCLESVQNAHDDAINAVVLSEDGLVYTGSADKTIKVWRKPDGEKKHSLVPLSKSINLL